MARQFAVELFLELGMVEQAGQAVADHEIAQRAVAFCPGHYGRYQALRAYGFGEEIVPALAHCRQLLVHVGFGGKKDDRDADIGRLLANDPGDLVAGTGGHVHVHQNQLRAELRQYIQDLYWISDRLCDHAGLFEGKRVEAGERRRIVDDQHPVGYMGLPESELVQFVDQGADFDRFDEIGIAAGLNRREPGREVAAGRHENYRY